MFLSPGDPGSRPASRPTSAHYQKDSDDDDQYPISVQTASSSRPSQNGSQLSLGSHQQRARASVYGDHLAPSSRASSRASVRVSNRLSTYVTPEDSHRRRGRSRSRARSPVRNPANSRPRPESAISIHDKASLRSRTNAAPPAGSPPAPYHLSQYDRGTKLQERTFEYTIEPMQMSYPLEGAPDLWEAHTHPEGALYFRHRHRRIYTEAWLCDPEVLDEIEDFLVHLDETTYTSGCMLPPDAELVLELENIPPNANEHNDLETNKPAKHYWTYYYVNHASRLLFWVQSHEVSQKLEVLRGFHSSSHISGHSYCALYHKLTTTQNFIRAWIEEFYW
ncbi:hypothetical protein C8Q72DRAFT_891558 [Fomitopsis betulina]|nr:hypothetical protein C8Q72DRAFT_891558 [Fomitopsis betulina]